MYYENNIMVGIDISSIRGDIIRLEDEKESWDGLKGYSLNYQEVEIGYCAITKRMFGKVIARDAEYTNEDGDMFLMFDVSVNQYEAELVSKFKEFLATYPTLEFKGEMKLKFASVVGGV